MVDDRSRVVKRDFYDVDEDEDRASIRSSHKQIRKLSQSYETVTGLRVYLFSFVFKMHTCNYIMFW